MVKHAAVVSDLCAFVRTQPFSSQRPADVHFTPEGYQALARQVAKAIRDALKAPKAPRAGP